MSRVARVALCLGAMVCSLSAAAQDLSLTRDCEVGFRQFINLAEAGRLGTDVSDANVAIADNQVRVELVRAGAPNKLLFLTRKRSPESPSRYFDIALGEGATADDLDRVGKALDEVFSSDPFQIVGLEASPDGEPISSLIEAWGRDGWSGVARAWERRAMVLASLRYTVGVIVLVALALLLSLALLWGSRPPRSASDR